MAWPDTSLVGEVCLELNADLTASPTGYSFATDITSLTFDRDGDSSIVIRRGRQDEQSQMPPSTCELTVDNTAAGIRNQQLLNDQIKKIDAVRQAEIAKSDGSVAAINAINAEYDKQLAKLLKVAAAAGDSKTNLEALAKKYYIDIIVTREERNQITKANAVDRALANLLGFASGGTVPGPIGKPRLAVVHGGERVLTPGEAANSDSGGTSQVVVSFEAPPAGSGLEELWRVLRKYIRVNGGDVQTVLGV